MAAVDLGSNSFHMVVARMHHGQLTIIDRLREMVRLASGLTDSGYLDNSSQDHALGCLRRFGQRLRDMQADKVRVVGTNTLRRARNAATFLVAAEEALGHPVEVISGIEEARLIYLGVSHHIDSSTGRSLVIDIGGGSTELIIGEGFEPRRLESLAIGCVGLSREHFGNGKLTAKRFERARLAVRPSSRPGRSRRRGCRRWRRRERTPRSGPSSGPRGRRRRRAARTPRARQGRRRLPPPRPKSPPASGRHVDPSRADGRVAPGTCQNRGENHPRAYARTHAATQTGRTAAWPPPPPRGPRGTPEGTDAHDAARRPGDRRRPDLLLPVLTNVAGLLLQLDRRDEAAAWYRHALTLDPQNAAAQQGYAASRQPAESPSHETLPVMVAEDATDIPEARETRSASSDGTSERAMLLVDGRRRVLGRFRPRGGRLTWFGQVNGRPVRPGVYELRLRAFDRAGNRSRRTRAMAVRVRYVELRRDRIVVVAGHRFGVRVDTDASVYRWLFAGRRGEGRKELLVLRAPDMPGTYAVYVAVGRFADRAEVLVTEPDVS